MRKLLLILLLSLLFFPLSMQAGLYGTLKGKVLDAAGKPVIGATVRVLGTSRGGFVKDKKGKFTVMNIDAGSYEIKVTAIGYKESILKDVGIHADDITFVEIILDEEGVTTDVVNVVASRVMVNNTEIGTKRTMSKEEIVHVAREGLNSIIGLSAGVTGNGNFSIRGGRTSETQVRIDGLDVTDQFVGSGGGPTIGAFDTEEIQVLTGGFSAEYGNAQSGYINTSVRTGRTDRFDGYLRYRTDTPLLNGSQASGKRLIWDDSRDVFRAIPSGDGAQIQGPGQHRVETGIGGPLPLLNNSTFYISTNYTYRKFNNAGFEIYDPFGNNLGQMPNNQSWSKNTTLRLKFGISNDIKLILGGSFGLNNTENSSVSWLYANDEGWTYDKNRQVKVDAAGNPITNGIPERVAKQGVYNWFKYNGFIRINHTLDETSFYEFTISNTTDDKQFSKRKSFEDPGYFTGFEQYLPYDDYGLSFGSIVEGKRDKIVDGFEPIKKTVLSADGYLTFDQTQRHPYTGYIEGQGDATGTDNPYGRDYAFYTHGNTTGLLFRKSNFWQVDGNYSKSIEGEFNHMIKTGFEFRYYTVAKHQNNNPYDGIPFMDVFDDRWSGNIYTSSKSAWEKTSKPYNPMRIAAYLQDQISYKGIIISPGLRFDLFLPESGYRENLLSFVSIAADSGFGTASMKYQVSPRINITYPITERSNISINYGVFFQMSTLNYLYDGYATTILRGNQIVGDPNSDAQRTNAYTVNYNNQLTDDFAFTVSGYYKDQYNQTGTVYVPSVPTPYYIYSVSEYGSIKGLEFELNKRPTYSDHIGLRLNYTLAEKISTASDVTDNYNVPVDPYSNTLAFPLAEMPDKTDIRHRVTFILDFSWFNNQGPSIGGIQPLENFNLNFTTIYRSGSPYTRTDLSGIPLGEQRTERGPSFWQTDFRVHKSFKMKDWFGESMEHSELELSMHFYNVFNLNSAIGLYSATNDPDDPGLNFRKKIGDFSSIPYYKNPDFSNPNTINKNQYDNFGNRRYNKVADTDNNGKVDQQEKFEAYMLQLTNTTVQFQGNYQTPRSAFFTATFRF